jgi:DNA-binding CsgD family transcriptional regulator
VCDETVFKLQKRVAAQDSCERQAISVFDAECCAMICMSNILPKFTEVDLRIGQVQFELLLDHISLPIYLLSQDRFLVYANVAGHEHLTKFRFVQLLCGRFQILGDALLVSRFEKAVHTAANKSSGMVYSSSTMTLGEPRVAQASITVTPFAGSETYDPLALAILTAQDECEADVTSRLRQTLGLTPAEARVAYFISTGHRPKLVADHLKISVNTVKSHLASIFSKTGCTDQAAFCLLAKQLLTPVRMS